MRIQLFTTATGNMHINSFVLTVETLYTLLTYSPIYLRRVSVCLTTLNEIDD